jgi:hypothetical protein
VSEKLIAVTVVTHPIQSACGRVYPIVPFCAALF